MSPFYLLVENRVPWSNIYADGSGLFQDDRFPFGEHDAQFDKNKNDRIDGKAVLAQHIKKTCCFFPSFVTVIYKSKVII